MHQINNKFNLIAAICLILTIISCVFVAESMAGKNKGDDIILYNGNIIVRGGKGKGKGGSIVVANSQRPNMDLPFMWGGFRRRR